MHACMHVCLYVLLTIIYGDTDLGYHHSHIHGTESPYTSGSPLHNPEQVLLHTTELMHESPL